ncbi:MAG: hypothetical protein MSJ26_02155 [Oscillospiraceae bacterium]|nr:hypothetical protein [Oscillospiraceae bacterium]
MEKFLRTLKRISPGAIVFLIAAALIWAGRESAKECAKAAALCISVLIPSLFAFTAASKLLISTETYKLLGRPFSLFSRYVLRMPEEFFPVFLISQLAGYPIGAALISEMRGSGRLTREMAEELLCFCIAPGPAYIMAVASAAAPKSSEAWISVMLGVTGANLAAALVTAPFRKIPEKSCERISPRLTAEDITAAACSASESMTMICAMVLLMAALMGIFTKAGLLSGLSMLISRLTGAPPAQVYPFARSFFEISNLCGVFGDSTAILPLSAAFLSFGGLCVHMQISAVCKGFSPMKAFIWRGPSAAAAYLICRSLIPKFCVVSVISVSAPVYEEVRFSDYSPLLSIILLIMTILILSQKNVAKSKKI